MLVLRDRFLKQNAPPAAHPKLYTRSERILMDVAEKHTVTVRDIRGRSHFKEIVAARFEAAYRLRKELGLSFNQVGRQLGNRTHATIIHAVRTHEAESAWPS